MNQPPAITHLSETPKLGPTIVVRYRVQQWFARHADVPLRFIAAPAGSGKTVATVNYVRTIAPRAAYWSVPKDASTGALLQAISRLARLEKVPKDYESLIAALTRTGRFEFVFDNVERATPELMAWLERLVDDVPDEITFVYTTRSRCIFDVTSMLARGVAVIFDGASLAFTADEAAQLAAKVGVPVNDAAVGRLLFETEGWAVALAGAIRESLASACSLDVAYETWREKEGRRFEEFIEQDLTRVGASDRESLSRLMWGVAIEPERGARMEALGLPVRYVNGAYRPYRVLKRLQSRQSVMARTPAHSNVPVLTVQMFGTFAAAIDRRSIPWIRRRDQQLFKYLCLQPDHRAARNELIAKFWPESDRILGLQSLRTACSNIRKAIATLVGRDAAEHYLSIGRDIALNRETMAIDARRFMAHVNEGSAAFENGDTENALRQFRSAQSLYAGRLCDDDPLFEPYASLYESMLTLVTSRMREIAEHAKSKPAAQDDGSFVPQFAP